jgi:hypothetical protein
VAKRALVFSALTYRANIERWRDGARQQAHLLAWLSLAQLTAEVEPDEERVLKSPVGTLDPQDRINLTWRAEALAVLAWALGMMEMPAHDEQCPAPPIAEAFGLLKPSPNILAAPRLRTPDELAWYAERAFALHWRLRQFSLDGEAMDFAAFAPTADFGPLEIEGLPLLDRDLAIRGRPLARSDDWREVLSITVERHQAANWLLGEASLYSEVSTDT